MSNVRSEVQGADCWDVEALFPSVEAWEKEYEAAKGPWEAVAAFRGRLGESAQVLREAVQAALELRRKVERLYTYAHLRHDEDVGDDRHKGIYQRAMMLFHQLAEELAWMEPELLALPQETLDALLADPALADYQFYLEKIVRLKPHTLGPKEEQLVAMAGRALDTPSQAFSAMNNADFSFGQVEDSQGLSHELTHGSYRLMQRSFDRTLRKNSFEQLHGKFNQYENTLCELLNGQVQGHLFSARSHNFDSCLESALFPKNIDLSVYHSLIEAVRAGLPHLHRYMKLRKESLGVDALHLYDVYVPLMETEEHKVPWDRAVEQVVESVAPLGDAYQSALAQGLGPDRWCDRYENQGKRSGAYSSGCFDSHPYILMNYHERLSDVLTLAHEAGHSMHSYLSRKNQSYHYADYPIFVAEVASTFNEELLFRLLLRDADPVMRAFLINQKIDDIRATLFRQTMFAEFELAIHELAEQGMPLTPTLLKDKYRQLNADYFGPDVIIDEQIDIEWARIPHFYYNFYVYQYATGLSAALALAERIRNGSSTERDAYLTFLSSGSSKYPIDLLKTAGVDVTTPGPVNAAITTFGSLVDDLTATLQHAKLSILGQAQN
jgi:oligoendopeptidase F